MEHDGKDGVLNRDSARELVDAINRAERRVKNPGWRGS